jgi:hypothetical protein
MSYLVEYRTQKKIRTESHVFTPSGPQSVPSVAQWILQVEILDVHPDGDRATIHARSEFHSANPAPSSQPPAVGAPPSDKSAAASDTEPKAVEFTILPDGHARVISGLDALFPEQREVWQQWLRQFAIAAVFPRDCVRSGQTWKTTEPEQAPSAIARLQWDKSATYVRDEPCAPFHIQSGDTGPAAAPNPPSEKCAVVLTHAVLKQKSSPKNTTPDDFRARELSTSGTASGTNETISYISLQSGLIVRVNEDAKQFMDVIIAKTDASNKIHYNVDASSHTEVLLLAP